ncbi:uncharacterized protein LOC125232548 [Leguminivora glycinivorella]|uniref:uncharacterized protein LOC125232548 n=1 Tax=Leguminivora glycinivorella TaxID=1035111 RepID=UPI00200BF887|nr:uncharacterized protein LOC125232548 [Leguminivora glycinivorella]
MTTLYFVLLVAALVSVAAHTEAGKLKRQVPGGESPQDPNDAKYKKLAEESFQKYRVANPGGVIDVKEIKITKVTSQVVAGFKTRMDFTVIPTNGDVITCHSEILEQAWLNKKEIDVNCDLNQQKSKVKRQIAGGETMQDPNGAEYKALAQESLQKYLTTTAPGGQVTPRQLKVTKVTTQVVSGTITRIDFTVIPANGEEFTCHSSVWEQPWLNKKEINVDCDLNKQSKVKRQIPGGETERDPNSQEYKQLAKESLEKFSATYPGGPIQAKQIKVTKATSQVVSGMMYRLTFTVEPANGEKFTCHSKIWEQAWLNKKDIDVNCDLKG